MQHFVAFVTLLFFLTLTTPFTWAQQLPTVYEYFTDGGTVQSGLSAESSRTFQLNGKPLRIMSGTIHYFRLHPTQWRDSLKKLRATGANTVETYVPWSLHEPRRGFFDFGGGENDRSEFLDLGAFIQMAQEEDLLLILRPGPFICSELEFGGFPSWLLRDGDMRVREFYSGYLEPVSNYFDNLLPRVVDLQFVRGGPIIAIQMENEYGYFDKPDKNYIQFLVDLHIRHGFSETLLFTSDNPWRGDAGTLDQLLWTVNFNRDPVGNLDELLRIQPDKPILVTEFWSGWLDHWMDEKHDTGLSPQELLQNLEVIMGTYNGSVNFYTFRGATNFGFMAGGSDSESGTHRPVITSYEFDAPLTEAGDYTEKYNVMVTMAEKYGFPKLRKPVQPILHLKESYETVKPQRFLSWDKIIQQIPVASKFNLNHTPSMEMLDMNQDSGQSYGYIIYRVTSSSVNNGSLYKAGVVKDFATVVVNGQVQSSSFAGQDNYRYWINSEREIALEIDEALVGPHEIDLCVEAMARSSAYQSYENDKQRKGLPNGHISIDGTELTQFQVFALEFKSAWFKNLTDFEEMSDPLKPLQQVQAPIMIQSTFIVPGEPLDTYLDLIEGGFHKGLVFINNFNLGRYWRVGPQKTLYVPSWTLNKGENTITIFEQLEIGQEIRFRSTPDLGQPKN